MVRLVRKSSNDQYDLAVIGAGSAGLTAARFAARLGARVVLVERDRVGGDCTWTGCIPSKTIMKTARVAFQARHAERYGLSPGRLDAEWSSIMTHVRGVVESVHREESPEVLRSEGIDVVLGEARFLDPRRVSIGDGTVSSPRIVIATGAKPKLLESDGNASGVVTYQTVWDLDSVPGRLVVIGGGPEGCEMAQVFARLGSRVTLIGRADRLLPRDEPEVSDLLARVLKQEGVTVQLGAPVTGAKWDSEGGHVFAGAGEYLADVVLVAVGRVPDIDGLQLERAMVRFGPAGIQVDEYLRTSQTGVYAVGDCTGGYQFTHLAAWQGYVAARNALLPGKTRADRMSLPWVTFTDPEIAHVGTTEKEARLRYGKRVRTALWPMARVDRARTEVATDGFIKLIYLKGGRLRGATIASGRAGESIHGWSLALDHGFKVGDLARTLHAYPTYSLANMELAAELQMQRALSGATGTVLKWLSR